MVTSSELFQDVPPAMKLNLSTFLYGSVLRSVPMFRGMSDEVIGALCGAVRPLSIIQGQEVITEGQPGREMYILMSGELEVSKGATSAHGSGRPGKDHDHEPKVLGYLSEGAFFGESAVIEVRFEVHLEAGK